VSLNSGELSYISLRLVAAALFGKVGASLQLQSFASRQCSPELTKKNPAGVPAGEPVIEA